MRIVRLAMRNFRSYAAADVELGPGVTVVTGRNGAGKTNLLDALYFGCTGRSARTTNERELVRFGEQVARVEVTTEAPDGRARAERRLHARRAEAHDAPTACASSGCSTSPGRPLVSVFLPDRLELVKGTPSLRRAHMDQLVAALWPARVATRRALRAGARAAQRAARRASAPARAAASLPAWDRELARHGIALMADRAAAVELRGGALRRRAPRSSASTAIRPSPTGRARRRPTPTRSPPSWPSAARRTSSAASPATARTATTSLLTREGRELRAYGSQGQQRLGAARAAAGRARGDRRRRARRRRVMLLDDVMSELDRDRRARARRTAARRRAERHHDDRPRARPGRRGARRDAAARSPTGAVLAEARPREPPRAAPARRRARAAAGGARAGDAAGGGAAGVAERRRRGDRARGGARGERGGVVTVACSASVWAQELDLMAPLLIEQAQRRDRGRRGRDGCAA